MKKLMFLGMVILTISSCSTGKKATVQSLNGGWVLQYITGPRITFEGLYPEKKPTLVFDKKEKRAHGNSSCNSYNGAYTIKGNKIKFDKVATTMMLCPGDGESVYYATLDKINNFNITDGKLNLLMDDVVMMTFRKQ